MEGFKVNRLLSGFLVYDRIMPVAKRLSSRFYSCPLSARLSQATAFFAGNLYFAAIDQPPKEVYYLHILLIWRKTVFCHVSSSSYRSSASCYNICLINIALHIAHTC